jgi:MFS family permease
VALAIFFSVAAAGDCLVAAASSVFVYEKTGSKSVLGAMEVAFWLPVVVTRLASVPVLDSRIGYRKLMLFICTVECLVSAGAGLLFQSGQLHVWHVFVIQIFKGSALGMAYPLSYALIPRITPASKLAFVDSALEATGGALLLVGPPVGAWTVKTFGPGTAFLLDGSTLLFVLTALLTVREMVGPGSRPAPVGGGYAATLKRSVRLLSRSRDVLGLSLVIGLLFMGERAIARQVLPYAVENLGSDVMGMGVLQAASAVGYVAGGLWGMGISDRRRRRLIGLVLAVCSGLLLASLSVFHRLALAGIAISLSSLAYPLCATAQNLVFQQKVPDEVRGAVIAVGTSVNAAVGCLGALIGGILAQTLGLSAMLAATGLFIALCLAWPPLWRSILRPSEDDPGAPALEPVPKPLSE